MSAETTKVVPLLLTAILMLMIHLKFKNSVVIVTGNLTCGKLFMKDGARLYVKGKITANDMSYDGDSNQKIYCGGDAIIPHNLDSSREFKIGGNLEAHELSLTYTNYYFGGSVKCTKFNAENNDMNLIVDSFECSGTTTLNNRTSLTVNGNAKQAPLICIMTVLYLFAAV